jgi:hypothetical protein
LIRHENQGSPEFAALEGQDDVGAVKAELVAHLPALGKSRHGFNWPLAYDYCEIDVHVYSVL